MRDELSAIMANLDQIDRRLLAELQDEG